ncbi:MAG: hypothetical protein D3916_16425 [Candidatus Electrothrix sp. MAN1_4]|nr:hypothetical protein [Candidatus Electrothrix sp. MAN1_4]
MTAPKAEGQARALNRAYACAGWDINDVEFIEGHGTGTAAGDKAELEGIALAMGEAGKRKGLRRCGVTSLKSIIGHTKAASGIGALIKTVIALNRRVLPPLANCTEPSAVFTDKAASLYPVLNGQILEKQKVIRAGVSGMGFGGINCHLALASSDDTASPKLSPALREQQLLAAHQETEIFIFSGATVQELLSRIREAEQLTQGMSEGELSDLAFHLTTQDKNRSVRAAVLASTPELLEKKLTQVAEQLIVPDPTLSLEDGAIAPWSRRKLATHNAQWIHTSSSGFFYLCL